jgi:hypothetical protein
MACEREIMLGFVTSALWKNSSRPPSLPLDSRAIHTYVHTYYRIRTQSDLAKDRSCLQGLILKKRRTLANEAVLPPHGQALQTWGGHISLLILEIASPSIYVEFLE